MNLLPRAEELTDELYPHVLARMGKETIDAHSIVKVIIYVFLMLRKIGA